MNIEVKGSIKPDGQINNMFNYLQNISNKQRWEYSGFIVEIDPTVDFEDQNILVRWTDIEEGFNDKILVYSLSEFNSQFKSIQI